MSVHTLHTYTLTAAVSLLVIGLHPFVKLANLDTKLEIYQ